MLWICCLLKLALERCKTSKSISPYMLCLQDTYHHCWEIRPGFPSSAHSFQSSECGTHKLLELNPFWTLHWPVSKVCTETRISSCPEMAALEALPCQGPGLQLDKGTAGLGVKGISAVSTARLDSTLYTRESNFLHVCSVQGPPQLCRQPWLQSSWVNPGKSQLPLPMRCLF